MKILLLALISAFVLGNILTEWRNRKTLPWTQNPMSAYLADVPWAILQDVGFLALAAALIILGHTFTQAGIAFVVAGIALVPAVLTKYYIAYSNVSGSKSAQKAVQAGAISSAQASAASSAAEGSIEAAGEPCLQRVTEAFSCNDLAVTDQMLAAGVRAYWDACFFDSSEDLEEVQQEIVKEIYIAMCKAR